MKKYSWIGIFSLVLLLVFPVSVSAAFEGMEGNNVNTIGATTQGAMPCVGEPKILVFYTTFSGGDVNWTVDAVGTEHMFFDEESHSLRSFYQKSSYGKVDITGTLYEYTTKHDTSYYGDFGAVLDEIIDYYKDDISWADYDSNNDGYIDGIYLVARTRHSWGGPNFVGNYSYKDALDGKLIAKACFIDSQDVNTICHETCHMFGPADMYANVGLNPNGIMTESIMDSQEYGGDLPGITKFVLGWMNPTFISGEGSFDINLPSYSVSDEMIVICPNGDETNPNWMIVEYVTPEHNNHYSGVRIWKSNMYLDENYNIIGSTEFCNGSPNSPYEYLEAMHPEGVRNYYYLAGEEVTPYTLPSSAYAKSYKWVGGAKYMDELGFSGISIHINSISEASASITVEIDNDLEAAPVDAQIVLGHDTAEFINDTDRVMIACVKASTELKVVGDIYLYDIVSNTKIPVSSDLTASADTLYLYVNAADVQLLELGTAYELLLTDAVKTYAGGPVNIQGFDNTIKFDFLPKPVQYSQMFSNGCSTYEEHNVPDYFRKDDTHVSYFALENGEMWFRTIDIANDVISEEKVAANLPAESNMVLHSVKMLDNQYYAAIFTEYKSDSSDILYIALYDCEGNLLDEYTPFERGLCTIKLNSTILQYNNELAYELTAKEDKLVFKDVSGLKSRCNLYGYWGGTGIYKLKENVYALFQYLGNDTSKLIIADIDSGVVKEHSFIGVECEYVRYVDDKLYLVTMEEDLMLYTYDSQYALIKEETLLIKPGVRYATNMYLEITEAGLWTSFDGVASSNTIDYQTTFMLTYDRKHNLKNYYRYGDKTFRYCGNIVELTDGCYVLGTANMYSILSGSKSENAETGLVYDETTGQFYYYEDGEWIADKYALVEYGGGRFLVINGTVAVDVNGVALYDDTFYFFANGQVQDDYTGLALYDNEWFYVVEGVLQTEYNGLLEHDGGLFFVAAGRIVYDAIGLAMFENIWYYLVYGQVQTEYTGLVAHDGAWFYLVDGILASNYTGEVEYDGYVFQVVCGQVIV